MRIRKTLAIACLTGSTASVCSALGNVAYSVAISQFVKSGSVSANYDALDQTRGSIFLLVIGVLLMMGGLWMGRPTQNLQGTQLSGAKSRS